MGGKEGGERERGGKDRGKEGREEKKAKGGGREKERKTRYFPVLRGFRKEALDILRFRSAPGKKH